MVMQANKKSLNLSGRDNNRRSIRPPCPSVSSAVQKSADQRYRVTESYPQGGTGIPAGEIDYIYYDSQWQAIETRTNGTAISNVSSQMVWSAAYINAAILQDSYIAGVIQPNSRLYFLQDANWNTTAAVGLINAAWQVLQYYVYSPYGTITVLNEDGAGSTPVVNNLYQGMTLDPVTGLYYARNRNYSPTLGRWINQDPAGYINGANTYQFVMGNPVNRVDPWGLWHWYNPWTWNWSWLPWAAKAVVKVAPHAVLKEGAMECELPKVALGTLKIALQHKLNRAIKRRMYYDYANEITQDNIYNALNNFDNGFPLTPSQQQIVEQWLHGDLNVNSPNGQ